MLEAAKNYRYLLGKRIWKGSKGISMKERAEYGMLGSLHYEIIRKVELKGRRSSNYRIKNVQLNSPRKEYSSP
jgi:hypothetical protein